MTKEIAPVHVIGAGMAGSEATWQLAQAGVPVVLHEMRPIVKTDAHHTDGFAELVCSNSFRSDDAELNAVGLLHEEMRRAGSIMMEAAAIARVPAGGALAVDRDIFSDHVTAKLSAHPLVTVERGEIAGLPPAEWDNVIVATGPLTSDALGKAIEVRGDRPPSPMITSRALHCSIELHKPFLSWVDQGTNIHPYNTSHYSTPS